MVTYKERQSTLKHYVLRKDEIVLGTFGNLKKVVDYINQQGIKASYHTLARKREFPISYKGYLIDYVKHF